MGADLSELAGINGRFAIVAGGDESIRDTLRRSVHADSVINCLTHEIPDTPGSEQLTMDFGATSEQ